MSRVHLREPFCAISHCVGALLSVAGLVWLLTLARGRGEHIVAFTVYGLSLIFLYSASALYHGLSAGRRWTDGLQRLDYITIFLLIAGSYTPVCMLILRGGHGYAMLAAQYLLAALGIGLIVFWRNAPHWPRVVLYLVMGWMAVVAMPNLRTLLPPSAILWLLAGGLCYTVGCVIYAVDRPHLWPDRFSAHDLWHVFVMAGSACHFILILRFIAMA